LLYNLAIFQPYHGENKLIFKSLNIKKTTTYNIGNLASGFGQAQQCGWMKPVNVIQALSPL